MRMQVRMLLAAAALALLVGLVALRRGNAALEARAAASAGEVAR
jgi:hypothetical protein